MPRCMNTLHEVTWALTRGDSILCSGFLKIQMIKAYLLSQTPYIKGSQGYTQGRYFTFLLPQIQTFFFDHWWYGSGTKESATVAFQFIPIWCTHRKGWHILKIMGTDVYSAAGNCLKEVMIDVTCTARVFLNHSIPLKDVPAKMQSLIISHSINYRALWLIWTN